MTEINVCPVCSYRGIIVDAPKDGECQVECGRDLSCGTKGPVAKSEEEAIAAWNRLSYKAPVKKAVKVAWVSKNGEGGGKISFAILLDNVAIEPYYRGLEYDIVSVTEVEFEIE